MWNPFWLKWRMEVNEEIEDLASVELSTGNAQQSEPLCSVLGDNGGTTKVYINCPKEKEDERKSKL